MRRRWAGISPRFTGLMIMMALAFGLLAVTKVREVAASSSDVLQALRYYEGTWSVDVHPAEGMTTSLRPYSVSISCSDVASGRECRSHFVDANGCCASRDFQYRYVKWKKDPTIVYEKNLLKQSTVRHWLVRDGQIAEGEDSVEKGSFCGRGDSAEEEMHVLRRDVYTIEGSDQYELERFSKWDVRPACVDQKPREWVLEMTAMFHREK
jgi:hypothetical protein